MLKGWKIIARISVLLAVMSPSASLYLPKELPSLVEDLDQLSAPLPDALLSREGRDFEPSDMAEMGEMVLRMAKQLEDTRDMEEEEDSMTGESFVVPAIVLPPMAEDDQMAEDALTSGSEHQVWVAKPLKEPGFATIVNDPTLEPTEEEADEPSDSSSVSSSRPHKESPPLRSKNKSEAVLITQEKPPGWDQLPQEVKSKVEAVAPSKESAWVIVSPPPLDKTQLSSPEYTWTAVKSGKSGRQISDYVIPPSEPDQKPHLRVLNFSYKSKVRGDEEGKQKSVYKSQLKLESAALFQPEEKQELDKSARVPRKSAPADLDLFKIIHEAPIEQKQPTKAKKTSSLLGKNKGSISSKRQGKKTASLTKSDSKPRVKEIKSLQNKPKVSSLPNKPRAVPAVPGFSPSPSPRPVRPAVAVPPKPVPVVASSPRPPILPRQPVKPVKSKAPKRTQKSRTLPRASKSRHSVPSKKKSSSQKPKEKASSSPTPRPQRAVPSRFRGGKSKKHARVVKKKIPIVKMVGNASQDKDRKFEFEYVTGNGVSRVERGYLKNPESKNPIQVMQGTYSYLGTDGEIYTIEYIADERGFRPRGVHIPRPNSG